MAITAGLVKELRERTGAGMMECKKALLDTGGDIEKAIEAMRKSGQAKADKKAVRVAAEGVIAIELNAQGKRGAMVEVNCETDFVAKEDGFRAFAQQLAKRVLDTRPDTPEELARTPVQADDDTTIDERRKDLVAQIGENITIRRMAVVESDEGIVGGYSHGGRIGVLVALERGDAAVAKDIAMHIAASRPVCVAEGDVPHALLEKEREIYSAQAADSGKPPEIVEKMVSGRLKKFFGEVTLLGQPFVKNPEITVKKYLSAAGASVSEFHRFQVGEGIEKRVTNFAQEVMTQVQDTASKDNVTR